MSTLIVNPTIEQEQLITDFLELQKVSFYKEDDTDIPSFVFEEIQKSRQDIKAGRFITHEEFVRRIQLDK